MSAKGIIAMLEWGCCKICQLNRLPDACEKIEGFNHWDIELDFSDHPVVVYCTHYQEKPEER